MSGRGMLYYLYYNRATEQNSLCQYTVVLWVTERFYFSLRALNPSFKTTEGRTRQL